MDQFDHYENITPPLSAKDKQYIEVTTGCLYPCSYIEYKVSIYYNINNNINDNQSIIRCDALL